MEEYEVDLGDYLRVLWWGKWIILVVFLVAVGAALGISYNQPEQYQASTNLLILPPLAKEVGGQIGGTVFSPKTYVSLALANDLLKSVIDKAYSEEEEAPTVEGLRAGMKVEVEQPEARNDEYWPGEFPLRLQVTISGVEPERLKSLAEIWTQQFKERNSQLFASRTAQSYDYIAENFNGVNDELLDKEQTKQQYQQGNPVEVLQAEVSVLQGDYGSYLDQLREKRKELASKESELSGLEEAISQEPEFLVLQRDISDEAVWNFLAQGSGAEEMGALPSLTFEDQQLNTVYVGLRDKLISTRIDVGTLGEEIAWLESAAESTQAELEGKLSRLIEVQAQLERLDREISILSNSYTSLANKLQDARIAKAEMGEPIKVVEEPVIPTQPIGPRKKMNVAVAGVLGVFVGVLLAFFAHYIHVGREKLAEGDRGPAD